MQFLTDTNIDFVGKRRMAMILSLTLIAIGIGSLVMHGGPRYSIDFTGGSLIQAKFAEPTSVEAVRDVLTGAGVAGAEIQQFGAPDEILVRIQRTGGTDAMEDVKAALSAQWPEYENRREETVGPKIGGELRSAASQAIFLALFLILVYITIRFEFRFAVAAILALLHDVVITLGAFSLANHEVSLAVIAAFLTIVGYSLNDTIVVFDRIRENLRVPSREDYESVLNRSVNQSLSRTIITSGTTIVVVAVLLVFGGEVLRDFAFALTVGVIVGTYSSIFVATPLLVAWEKRRPSRAKSGARRKDKAAIAS
ncbi:MAG: protein-export membrane protein SecF [Gemmatimonadota bacterium]|nr:MAG: protein-export membrane protein SecF [Gemmatimonadota bacterium]